MAGGVLLLILGVALLSRLFRHDLAGKVATKNLFGQRVGSAGAAPDANGGGGGDFGGPDGSLEPRPVQGPAGGSGGVGYPLSTRGTLNGGPGQGTHAGGPWTDSNAIDINVPVGTAVLAPVSGTVTGVSGGWSGGAGRYDGYGVTIRGADGREYFLKHQRTATVRAGQSVTRAQVIGESGAGNGVPHLHIGVSSGNPLDLFGWR